MWKYVCRRMARDFFMQVLEMLVIPSVASIRASMRGAASLILGTIAKIDRCRSAGGVFKISW